MPGSGPSWTVKVAASVGRRGTVLLALGAIFVLYGVSVLTAPTSPFGGFAPFGLAVSPWGWLWIGCGALALTAAPRRGHPRWEAAGYNGLLLPPALWSLLHLGSWLAHLAGDPGNPRGWVAATVWGALIVIVLVVAGWPEPPRKEPR
jgi:hypothetical protein